MVTTTKVNNMRNGEKRVLIDNALKISVYFLGTTSLFGSIVGAIFQIHDKIFVQESVIPEVSFVFFITCIIFSISVIAGCHKERLDYLTPYFMTSVILTGYFVTVILLDISKWNLIDHPKATLLWGVIGLVLTSSSCVVMFKFMEKLKVKYGIQSTWQRIKMANSGTESGYDTE